MKRLMTAALALSLLGGTAASAQPRHDDHDNGRHDQQMGRHDDHDNRRYDERAGRHDNGHHYGQQKHRWARGDRLPSTYYSRNQYIDYRSHNLRAPPRGYQWVQVDNNYALVALTSGLISQLITGR